MPTQKVNAQQIDDECTHGWYTEVSWRKQPQPGQHAEQGNAPGHVQITTVNVHSPFAFPDKDTGDHFEAGEKFDGWRVTLDEDGIDRLIKTLHKAKRQAFGDTPPGLPSGPIRVIGDEQVAAAERGVYLPNEDRVI
ncbi:MAG: hypothetical protein WBA97_34490 [Actinophytocola sp.]|uniref:hypothetical protein n=1 Tax=Actinophytocola sp. TaxID=1872138 RepID=UPI003C78DEE9